VKMLCPVTCKECSSRPGVIAPNWEVDRRGVQVDTYASLASGDCFTSAFAVNPNDDDSGAVEVPTTTQPPPSDYDDDDVLVGGCGSTQFGCCENDDRAKEDSAGSNCDCLRNSLGCCSNQVVPKLNEEGSNCPDFVSLAAVDTVAGSSVTTLVAVAVVGLVLGLAMYLYIRSRKQSGDSMITNTAPSEYIEGPYPQAHQQRQQYPGLQATVTQTQL